MMTRQQLLLNKLAEEAAEVSQIALKAAQFGLDDVWEKVAPLTVRDRMHVELNDLLGVVAMLNAEFALGFAADPAKMAAKAEKVNHYATISVALGMAEAPIFYPPVPGESDADWLRRHGLNPAPPTPPTPAREDDGIPCTCVGGCRMSKPMGCTDLQFRALGGGHLPDGVYCRVSHKGAEGKTTAPVAPLPPPPRVAGMLIDRFLAWPLPVDFAPDCGISFTPPNHPNAWPVGTNLFTATQARAMLEHVLDPRFDTTMANEKLEEIAIITRSARTIERLGGVPLPVVNLIEAILARP